MTLKMASFDVHTSELFDPKLKKVRRNVSITIDPHSGTIVKVSTRKEEAVPDPLPEGDIDLRGKFVMPGLVDAHTHIFLHSYAEVSATVQKRDESYAERVIRATNHCRSALLAGYTTYRDLGTESMQDADANVRDAIVRGLMPGPRLFVATSALASSGSYEITTENAMGGLIPPAGSDVGDGVDGVRRAVRRRIAAGADIIKFYADSRRRIMRSPPPQQQSYGPGAGGRVWLKDSDPATQAYMGYSLEEMTAIVAEAKMAKCPVAAHAATAEAAMAAIEAGVTSIEHGFEATDEMFEAMVKKGTIFVPTLAVANLRYQTRMPVLLESTKRAYDLGVRLACGGDTGTFPHGENYREAELMMEAGVPAVDVLEACTVGGWESCGGDLCGQRFGWWEEGVQADIIALRTSLEHDKHALRDVPFVMKSGRVWKRDGVAIGMI